MQPCRTRDLLAIDSEWQRLCAMWPRRRRSRKFGHHVDAVRALVQDLSRSWLERMARQRWLATRPPGREPTVWEAIASGHFKSEDTYA